MNESKNLMKKVALPYGVVLGLLTVAISVIVYVLGLAYERPWWQAAVGTVITIGCIAYAIKAYKQENDGYLSLSEALKTGIIVSIIAGIIGVLYNYVFMNFIEPDFIPMMLETTRETMIEENPTMTQEQIDMGMSISEKMMSPGMMAGMGIIAAVFFGFVISLITGLVMKNPKPDHL